MRITELKNRTALMTGVLIAAISMMAAACMSNNTKMNDAAEMDAAQTEPADADVCGKWRIENIVFSETDFVRPAEETAGGQSFIRLNEDGSYHIATNCNSISGEYTVHGDSITFGDGAMTEMACDNMATEEAMRRILPHINIIDIENDSVMRLNSINSTEYIVLIKIK